MFVIISFFHPSQVPLQDNNPSLQQKMIFFIFLFGPIISGTIRFVFAASTVRNANSIFFFKKKKKEVIRSNNQT